MIAIIDGKRYNTETAEVIATKSNGYFRSDFKFEVTTLYRTKKGRFFTFGEGGPMSCYAESVGGGFSGGEKLTPLDDITTVEFLETMASTGDDEAINAIEKYFSVEEA